MLGSRLKKIPVVLSLLLLPVSVLAAGLGSLNVDSGIGEPLQASIELLEVSAKDLASITAVIAPQEVYAKQGIDRPSSHANIKIDITKNAQGRPILKLNSRLPMDEPFLDMLIQLDWSTGRLLREYTVLLDPLGYEPAARSTQAPVVQSNTASKKVTSSPTIANRKEASQSSATQSSNDAQSTNDYVTKKGDTLSKIARSMKPSNVSLNQMLIALYRDNKGAFSGENINRLNVGKVIRGPSQTTVNAISKKAAFKEVKVQVENWNAYRNKLAGIVAESAPVETADNEANTQTSGGAIKSAAEDKSTPKGDGPKDVVKLSTVEVANSVGTKSSQEKVAALQEEVVARERGLQEAQERTVALKKQIEDMQKLLALKNNVMANAQNVAAADQSATNPGGAVTTGEPVVEEANAVAKTTPAPAPAIEPDQASTKPVEKEPEVAKPKIKAGPVSNATLKITSVISNALGFFSNVMAGIDKMLLAAAALVALLLGEWVFLRIRRKKNLGDFEQSMMTSGGLKESAVFGNTSSASADNGDTSFLTDFSQSENGSMIDTHDVDPIAEAEVYMAYGRNAQAEEILKDAISKEPPRYELQLKLLEIYAESEDLTAFETVAGELYTTLGAEDSTWAKVAEIGIKLEPSNPLYQVEGGGRAKVAASNKGVEISNSSKKPAVSEDDMDFSFDAKALKDEIVTKTSDEDSLVANFETPENNEPSALEMPATEFASLSAYTIPAAGTKNVEESGTFDLSDISLDVEKNNSSTSVPETPVARITEETESRDVETKLDLVAAYIEMDDKEGAKELLNEVVKEGGPDQRTRAEKLLSKIS